MRLLNYKQKQDYSINTLISFIQAMYTNYNNSMATANEKLERKAKTIMRMLNVRNGLRQSLDYSSMFIVSVNWTLTGANTSNDELQGNIQTLGNHLVNVKRVANNEIFQLNQRLSNAKRTIEELSEVLVEKDELLNRFATKRDNIDGYLEQIEDERDKAKDERDAAKTECRELKRKIRNWDSTQGSHNIASILNTNGSLQSTHSSRINLRHRDRPSSRRTESRSSAQSHITSTFTSSSCNRIGKRKVAPDNPTAPGARPRAFKNKKEEAGAIGTLTAMLRGTMDQGKMNTGWKSRKELLDAAGGDISALIRPGGPNDLHARAMRQREEEDRQRDISAAREAENEVEEDDAIPDAADEEADADQDAVEGDGDDDRDEEEEDERDPDDVDTRNFGAAGNVSPHLPGPTSHADAVRRASKLHRLRRSRLPATFLAVAVPPPPPLPGPVLAQLRCLRPKSPPTRLLQALRSHPVTTFRSNFRHLRQNWSIKPISRFLSQPPYQQSTLWLRRMTRHFFSPCPCSPRL